MKGFGAGAPGNAFAGEEEAIGEMRANLVKIMQHADDGTAFFMPALDDLHKVASGGFVNSIEGFIEEDEVCILNEKAGEKGALELACGKACDIAVLKSA